MKTIKAIIIEGDETIRAGIQRYLEQHGVNVIGEAYSVREFVGMYNRYFADVIILNLMMQDMELKYMAKYIRDSPNTQVIAITYRPDRIYIKMIVEAGQKELINTRELQEELARDIENARSHKPHLLSEKRRDDLDNE